MSVMRDHCVGVLEGDVRGRGGVGLVWGGVSNEDEILTRWARGLNECGESRG